MTKLENATSIIITAANFAHNGRLNPFNLGPIGAFVIWRLFLKGHIHNYVPVVRMQLINRVYDKWFSMSNAYRGR